MANTVPSSTFLNLTDLVGMTPLGKTTASSSASVESPTLSSSYSSIMVIGSGIVPATDDVSINVTFSDDNGANYKSSSYRLAINAHKDDGTGADTNSQNAGAINLNKTGGTEGIGNGSTEGAGFTFWLDGHAIAGQARRCRWVMSFENSETIPKLVTINGGGVWDGGTTAIDKIKFSMNSGIIASGVFEFFGISGSV